MADIYQEIYRQQKEMYMVEYNTEGKNKSTSRQIMIEYQDRKIGGKEYSSYDPDTLMSATGSTTGLSEPEKVMHEYQLINRCSPKSSSNLQDHSNGNTVNRGEYEIDFYSRSIC